MFEEKKKQIAAEWSTKIKKVQIEIHRLADARSKGEELRPVKCTERINGNVVEIVRLDQNAVVEVRPAEMRDLQTDLADVHGDFAPPTPEGFDEGPRDMGPDTGDGDREPLASDPTIDSDENDLPLEDGGTMQGAPTGVVYDENDQPVGEGVESSSGEGVYVSGEQPCGACGDAITEDDKTSMVDGVLIHTKCEPEDLSEAERESARASEKHALPTPTMSATLGERTEAKKETKTTAPKVTRDRSAKSNSKKKKK
jgi:hypothetical protein